MESSDEGNGSDGEIIDDILGPEDLFSDGTDEDNGDDKSCNDEAKESSVKPESAEKIKKKKRRVVRNPRVTLNFDSLKGNNGLSALKKLFKNFKFKGSGHEKEDLTKIIEILQQWMCYQLFPSYNFESCMLQLEALGKKKVVQTLMKKYRLGMDDWGETNSDKEKNATADNPIDICENANKNEFDLLLDEEIANARSDDEIMELEVIQPQNKNQGLNQNSNEEFILTPEQLERIARNRKLAEERRMKRMSSQLQPMNPSFQPEKTVDREISS